MSKGLDYFLKHTYGDMWSQDQDIEKLVNKARELDRLKQVNEITEEEARKLFDFVFDKQDYTFLELSLKPTVTEDGHQQITFSGRNLIGIVFYNGQDRCILHFDNTKAVLWLYKNGYDISKLLEANSFLSEMEQDFDNFAFSIQWLSKGEEGFKEGYKQNWNLEYVTKKCKELLDLYYYKDYE